MLSVVETQRHHVAEGPVTVGVSGVWATVWATTTGAVGIVNSDAKRSAGIDHLRAVQLVMPDGVPSEGRPPQNHRVDA